MATLSQPSATRENQPNRIEVFSGEMEIHMAPPFDSAHIIQIMRQLQKYGCLIRYSSGSFRDGCLMAVSVDESIDVVGILSEVPGTEEVTVTHRPADGSGLSEQHPLARLLDEGSDTYQIMVKASSRSSIVPKSDTVGRESLEKNSRPSDGTAVSHAQKADRTRQTGIVDDGWVRRLTYDVRNTARRRSAQGGARTAR